MKLAEKTWTEVSDYLNDNDTLIIPVGTCEQHGRHLPLDTDIVVCEYFAEYLSYETGVLVAPTINYGVNLICDKDYCGTTGISESTLVRIVRETVDWWETQGFKRFLLLTYHGEPLHLKALRDSGEKCHLLVLYDIDYSGILEKQDKVKHACEAETSLMMYLFPDRLRNGEMKDCTITEEDFNNYVQSKKLFDRNLFPGSVGFCSKATPEKGKMIENKMRQKAIAWFNGLSKYL